MFIISLTLLLISNVLWSQTMSVVYGNGTPAPGLVNEFKQPNGSIVHVKLLGDAVINWLESIDGYKLMLNDDGYLCYSILDQENNLVASNKVATDPSMRTAEDNIFLSSVSKEWFYSKEQIRLKKEQAVYGKENVTKMGGFPTKGTRKLLLILARFSDQTFTYSQSTFNNLMNQANYNGTGSFKDYYYEVSYGQLVVNTTVTQVVTLPNTRAYYGANTGGSGTDIRPSQAVRDAVIAANNAGLDFSQFDNDGDGYVDLVAVIHSGTGEEATGNTSDIWSHNWALQYGAGTVYVDGKYVNNYTLQPEKYTSSTITSIGVICHEFGHALGLPDFYDTDNSTGGYYQGTYYWDIMAAGSWLNNGTKPAHHNAWSKVYLGWVSPVTLSSAQNITASNVEQNKQIYKVLTTTTNDYFLIENRQRIGFDTYLPGKGLLIYHIHPQMTSYISSNSVNTTHPQRVYIVNAGYANDPKQNGSYGEMYSPSVPFPGTGNKTMLTDATTPNMKSWANNNTNKPITNIVENSSTKQVSFSFMGGGSSGGSTPTVTTTAVTNLTSTTVTLNGTVKANNNTVSVQFLLGTSSSNLSYTFNANPSSVTGTTTTSVNCNLIQLTPGTTYYYRVKVTYNGSTVLGSILNFTTPTTTASAPVVTTTSPTNVTSSTATLNGQVNAKGLSTTVKFLLWTSSNVSSPWEYNASPSTVSGSTTTNVSISLTGFSASTTYYYKVVATSSAGTTNGNTISFTTPVSGGSTSSLPLVTSTTPSVTSSTTAIGGGNVSSQGTASVTQRGVCWNTTGNPTINDLRSINGSGTGSYSANLTGLQPNTTYYVRAYATNTYGTAYGNQVTIHTPASKSMLSAQPNNEEWQVYPNPTTGFVTFNNIEVGATIRVYSIEGKLCKTFQINNNENTIDLTSFENGIYLLEYSVNDIKQTKKIVISK